MEVSTPAINVNVEFNSAQCENKIKQRIQLVQKKLDSQVLKDSNVYCPEDTSALMKSGINKTVIGSGLIKWETPYARAQYYNNYKHTHSRNPQAQAKWFEVAKSKRLNVWRKLVNDEYNSNS